MTPRRLGFVAHEAEDGLKDTVRNILESKEYAINMVTEAMANQVQICSENFPPSVSEVAEVGFHALSSSFVRASRIAESPSISNVVRAGRSNSVTTHLLVGEIITTTFPRRRRLRTSRGSSGDEFAGTDGRPQLLPDRR